jgi:hypothetical protein
MSFRQSPPLRAADVMHSNCEVGARKFLHGLRSEELEIADAGGAGCPFDLGE